MDEMEFGYEERSKRLIERLDRIQNYLQSLPPLPIIGSASASEEIEEKDLKEEEAKADQVQSAGSRSSEGSSSDGTSTQKLSVSNRSQTIPKDDRGSVLLQQSRSGSPLAYSPESSKTSEASPKTSFYEVARKKKKKNRDLRVQDPLRPTGRTSFGLDIGQGINVINYIKQNCKPDSDSRAQRLMAIITKEIPKGYHTDRSLDRVYRQPPLPESSAQDSSTRWSDSSKSRAQLGNIGTKERSTKVSSPVSNTVASSDMDLYRVRYLDRAVELPHYHGLDTIQELFVPYMEHSRDVDVDRNISDS